MTVHNWALNEQPEKNIIIASFPWQVKWKRITLENMRYKPNILLLNTQPFLPGNFPALCHTHTHTHTHTHRGSKETWRLRLLFAGITHYKQQSHSLFRESGRRCDHLLTWRIVSVLCTWKFINFQKEIFGLSKYYRLHCWVPLYTVHCLKAMCMWQRYKRVFHI
jgi:hypothetical protein